ncbi:MAG: hypothetical protein J6M30_03255 [Bacteroidales bacterium]|nr:hypothetical protein [Bacteroidales bacterium]
MKKAGFFGSKAAFGGSVSLFGKNFFTLFCLPYEKKVVLLQLQNVQPQGFIPFGVLFEGMNE